MLDILKKGRFATFAIISGLFTLVPEVVFGAISWFPKALVANSTLLQAYETELNIIITRVLIFVLVYLVVSAFYAIYLWFRKSIVIKGNNYTIRVEYGDLFKMPGECKRVIAFDECFTTSVGNAPEDINPKSICGQYLAKNPDLDMKFLLEQSGIKPMKTRSKFKKKERYESGSIVPNGNDLLLSFATLDENGCGRFNSREEYLRCLSVLWKEIDKHYGQNDVCIPILGSGITRFDSATGDSISQQELLNIIIKSYELSAHKIKKPNQLRIVCKKTDDFSINNIDLK